MDSRGEIPAGNNSVQLRRVQRTKADVPARYGIGDLPSEQRIIARGVVLAPRQMSYFVSPVDAHDREPGPTLPSGKLSPDPVPEAEKAAPVPLLRALMPLIMVVVVIAMVGLMVMSGGAMNPMMLLFPLMMGMSLLMMFSPQSGADVDETRRAYLRHLGAVRTKAVENQQAQRSYESYYHPGPDRLWSLTAGHDQNPESLLWDKNADDSQALIIRIGLGTAALCTPIDVIDPGAPEDLDPVCAISLRQLMRSCGTVAEMPIIVSLLAFPVIRIEGDKSDGLLRAIITQLVFHHGPDVVGIEVKGSSLEWCKWLPHVCDPHSARYQLLIADSTVDLEQILEGQTENWATIIVVNVPLSATISQRAQEEGLVLRAGESLCALTESGVEEIGIPDELNYDEACGFARLLSKYRSPSAGSTEGASDLRRLVGVLDFDEASIDLLWRPRGSRRLAVPIGLTDQGSPFIVDIKESAHGGMGPHGLCVGATGSGKSELLRTLVLSLAVTHSPHDLNFVLVDFKGGATFLGLDQLPHTSAVITNLEQESVLVERMHDAISGEINRRQELLRSAGNFANVTEYNTARENNPELAPLPALFIVIDEFSELLGQHPDFADLFVAVGRLGRSLHVHLLLASQRLEEGKLRGLDSHLSYRIGLKTFSASESRQVLGVIDAYHLPSKPGSALFKATAEELTRFRASYVSGPLVITRNSLEDAAIVEKWEGWQQYDQETSYTEIDPRGRNLVDVVVESTQRVAKTRGEQAHKLWLPPLPAELSIAGIIEESGFLSTSLGIIDRPYRQRQDPFLINFSGQGGHMAICGGPQTGKTVALRSLILGLAVTHSTEQIRFYVLDLSGDGLLPLEKLPHVAGAASRRQEEKVRRIVDEVSALVANPEQRHTFLIIDGWHVMNKEFEELADKLGDIAADGLAARVHLVLSTPRWTAMRPAIRDLIGQRMELKLGESLDSLIDRKAQAKLPSQPGLGLTAEGECMLIGISSAQDTAQVIEQTATMMPVPALKMLPARLGLAELTLPVSGTVEQVIPIGIGGPTLERIGWNFRTAQHCLVIGAHSSGKTNVLKIILMGIAALGRKESRVVLLDHRRAHLGEVPSEMLAAYSAGTQQTHQIVEDTVRTLRSRLPGAEITSDQLRRRDWWEGPDIFLVIDDADLISDAVFAPLMPLLPHARDIGLHVVAARKVGGIQRSLYQPFLSEIKDQAPVVLLLDSDKEDGQLFGMRPKHLVPGRAQMVDQGNAVGFVQVAMCEDHSELGRGAVQ